MNWKGRGTNYRDLFRGMKKAVFWDVAPCRNCVNRSFGGTYCLHLQGRRQEEIRERTSRTDATFRGTIPKYGKLVLLVEIIHMIGINFIDFGSEFYLTLRALL
jgi:hypothetical protein